MEGPMKIEASAAVRKQLESLNPQKRNEFLARLRKQYLSPR